MVTLGSRVPYVQFKLGNRTDLAAVPAGLPASRIAIWLRDAYISLSWGNPFAELETSIQLVTEAGQDSYPYSDNFRAIRNLVIYRPDGTVITPSTKDIGSIRQMNSINQGAPAIWCDFGKFIYFRPVPDASYTCLVDYWAKPTITADVLSTLIQMPDDWLEVLDYGAALRGYTELQEPDKAKQTQELLFGYVNPQTGHMVQGIVQNLMNRTQATDPYKDWGLTPKGLVQSYGRKR